ncbi:MAG: LytTR family transcriptional regulator [Ruminococcus sp.]
MKITIENPLPGQEEEIVIRAENLSPKILELLQLLKTDEEKLTGYYTDGSMGLLDPDDVYYFESVDNKVFAYGEQNVAELKPGSTRSNTSSRTPALSAISKSMIPNLRQSQPVPAGCQRTVRGDSANGGESHDLQTICPRHPKAAWIVR